MHLVDNISIETFFQVAGADHNHASRNAVTVITDEGDTTKTTTSSNMNLAMSKANNDNRKYFFSLRVLTPWNNLHNSVKQAISVNDCKKLV